jgi:NAD(P)-dependent dehydrogenase (short-subunit alcohol dehydrogenase family)
MNNLFNIKNKNIVIVGGCGLIANNLINNLHELEANIAIVDIKDKPKLDLDKLKGNSIINYHKCDISNIESAEETLKKINKYFPSIDILINSMQYKPSGFLTSNIVDFPISLWDEIIRVNLTGTFISCKVFGSNMIKNKCGSIINFASVYGVVSSNPSLYEDNSMGNPIAYTASKGGVIMLTKYLAVHWAKKGIRVNCLSPHGVSNNHEEGFINKFNDLSPMKRMMNNDELLSAVLFLSSDKSSYMTGQNLVVDGGWTSW